MAQGEPVPNCIELVFIMSDGGDTGMECHTYWGYNGSVSATDLTTMCSAAYGQWGAHILPQQGNWVTLEECFGNDLASITGAQAAFSGASIGTSAGTGKLSSGTAFVLSFETSRKYRGGHSRIYIPGVPASDLADANSWTTTQATNMVTGWQAFRNALVAAIPAAIGIVGQVVAHRYGASATAPVLGAPSVRKSVPLTHPFTDPVTAIRGNISVGSQRRRNQYVTA
jgi:hypothetical protein